MKLLTNSGTDRVVDALRQQLAPGTTLDMATPAFSLFAFSELREQLSKLTGLRLVLPAGELNELGLLGTAADRIRRNQLQTRWLAGQCAVWLAGKAEVRATDGPLPQAMLVASAPTGPQQALTGACAFTTDGLGLAPKQQLSWVQASENAAEAGQFAAWFEQQWQALPAATERQEALLASLRELSQTQAPATVYHLMLYHVFRELGEELDEERIIKPGTGFRDSAVWKKLYKFQRDAVVGAIDKLERYGGCILADSVGLGKTFEALAVIKYYELRNDRVLVLVPKRLRDNWTLYKSNDKRNALNADRLHYDVLNHTDLSREEGFSGDIDLRHVHWGNYDLVVIDESHNFRNKKTPRQNELTRYDRLMQQIIQAGVKTRVLMLSATPVNNRLADLRNQIAFITEGRNDALAAYGITDIERTVRLAQGQFNQWSGLDEEARTTPRLLDMLGFDYFQLLDRLTIARSRKHIEKYYGVADTGRFPERRRPINIKADIDLAGLFPAIAAINADIQRLHLAAYSPLHYVLPEHRAFYDERYSTRLRSGNGIFRPSDREQSLVQLMRVNLLKRMESSVASFADTVERQRRTVADLLGRLDQPMPDLEALVPDPDALELDDPLVESLLVGNRVQVLLPHVDRIRWRAHLTEDLNRLDTLLQNARAVGPAQDAKLAELQALIADKLRQPMNAGNRKVIVFTAFADTAGYLYDQLAPWALEQGLHTALVNGSGRNRTTLPGLRADQTSILTAFAPLARERPQELADEGDLDLLIATDCISEGQNLQDCDLLVNYDIHWNPVRIIQRFGRIDRLGSPNTSIQLVNFWPNMALDDYINLEQRVSGRMKLLDVSATGEENLIEVDSGNQMNDLEYRRRQLLQLQEAVVDMEDVSSGLSIADLTLNDFRMDLAGVLRQPEAAGQLTMLLPGTLAVVAPPEPDPLLPPGTIFCLRAEAGAARTAPEPGYPLAPHYLLYVAAEPVPDGDQPAVVLPYTLAKHTLDRLKRLCVGRDMLDASAVAHLDSITHQGRDMHALREQLAAAVASLSGQQQQRAQASLFRPGGTHVRRGELAGLGDVEMLACVVVLPAVN